MKKRKGFTLAELLAVIVILGIITSITVPIVTNQIDKYKTKVCVTQYDNILNAARSYGADHLTELGKSKTITLKTLNDGGYIDASNMKDPITKNTISQNLKIIIEKVGKKYKYFIDNDTDIGCKDDYKNFYDKDSIFQGIISKEYTQGDKVSYLGYNWLVMKDNGDNTQLVMDGYLSESEIYENYPTDIDQSLKNKWNYVCPVLEYSKQSSNYDETRNNFLSKVENYCYTIWNGVSNEISEYTWNKSVIKKILENWINNKMAKKEFNKEIELKSMTFNDGIEQATGYVRIPTRDEIDKDGVYLAQITNSSMITDYSYLTLTACERASNGYQKIYIYNASYEKAAIPTELGSINVKDMKVRPVITVNEN